MYADPAILDTELLNPPRPAVRSMAPAPAPSRRTREQVSAALELLGSHVKPTRRVVRAGETLFRAGETFQALYVMNSGFFKMVNLSLDGREQVVGLKFRGDWLGLDGIANGRHTSDAVALDVGEVWAIPYDELLAACTRQPALMSIVHDAMSREISRGRDSMMSVCTLPADARVADFLYNWSRAMGECGKRTDQIKLLMTRAEIGSYLGLKLETVSRALSRLTRERVIDVVDSDRREIRISRLESLAEFIGRCIAPENATLQ
jgi:CRP/FNR family transcriptional regulator, anaerobic regulatory protein